MRSPAVATLVEMTTFSLRTHKLRPGEVLRDEQQIQLDPVVLGGQRYLPVPGTVEAELTVTRASTGTVFELRFPVRLHGPCYRCTADAVVDRAVSAREYHAESPGEAEELRTPYVLDDRLDLSAWARDALVLDLPDKILCREDCAGLCPVCGVDLNDEPHEHEDTEPDPRWAALAELRDRL
jgi:DUF177 domain-containing protein